MDNKEIYNQLITLQTFLNANRLLAIADKIDEALDMLDDAMIMAENREGDPNMDYRIRPIN